MPSKPKKTRLQPTANTGNAVIYARVSSAEQANGFSVDAQLRLLREWAVANCFNVIHEYIEDESAKSQGRRVFGEMIDHLEANPGIHVIVEKVDRLSRNWYDMGKLDAIGARIKFAKQGLELSPESSSSDKLIVGVHVLLAKHFIDNQKEEIRKGMDEKAKQGFWPTVAPIGYKNIAEGHKKTIAVDTAKAPLVRRLFEEYATGRHSLDTLRLVAREIGLTPPQAPSRNMLHKILTRSLYCGLVSWSGKTYPGNHEPIVSVQTWQAVQAILAGKTSNAGSSSKNFAYRGLMKCALCGCTITAESKKNGKYIYYRCTGMRGNLGSPTTAHPDIPTSPHPQKCPGMKMITEPDITAQYAAVLGGCQISAERMAWLKTALKESLAEERHTVETIVEAAQREAKHLRSQIEHLYLDRLNSQVPQWLYEKKRPELEEQLAAAELRMRSITKAEGAWYEKAETILELALEAGNLFSIGSPDQRRNLILELQESALIKDGILIISLKTPYAELFQASQQSRDATDLEIWYSGGDSNPRSPP